MKYISLRDKLIVAFVLLSVTAVALVGGYAYQQAKSALTARTFDQLISVRVVKKRQIESYFSDRLKDIRIFAESNQFTDNLPDVLNNKEAFVKTSTLSLILQFLEYNKYFKCITLFSDNNRTILFEPMSNPVFGNCKDSSIIKLFHHCISQKKYAILDNSQSGGTNPTVLIIAPFSDNCESRCALIFEIDIKTINNIMLETNPKDGVGESGESYIVASDLLMRTQSRLHKNLPLNIKVDTYASNSLIKGKEGTAEYLDYRNVNVLGSYSKLDVKGLNWFVIAEIDFDEAFKPIAGLRNSILLITVIISLIVFLVSFILSRQITIPIINLTTAASEIGEGKYNQKLKIITNDEIGKLTETFNLMVSKLKHSEEELQRERLKRLSASIDAIELERKRLSRELHDGLGQNLVAMKLKLESMDITKTNRANTILSETKIAMNDSISEVRSISNGLMPAVLIEFGIVNAIRNLCEELNEYSQMKVSFKTDFNKEIKSSRIKIYIFRIIQEALKNVIMHSKAVNADVELYLIDHDLIISIKDDGRGFDPSISNSGNGLYNIQERIALMGGEFVLKTSINNGTEIIAVISNDRLDDEENQSNIS